MPVKNRFAEMHDEITAWRRDMHEHPEIQFDTCLVYASDTADDMHGVGVIVSRDIKDNKKLREFRASTFKMISEKDIVSQCSTDVCSRENR